MLRSLYFWVLVAIVAGVTLGAFAPDVAVTMKPLGDGFIKLIKMMIAPVIFCTVVSGVAGMRSMNNAGRVGLKAIIYFEAMTLVALLIGIVVINVLQPGVGMNVDPATLDSKAIQSYASQAHEQQNTVDFLLHMIPSTFTSAFTSGDILQVLVVSLLFAIGLLLLGDRGFHLQQLLNEISEVLFKIIGIIVKLAPIGAFGAMAFTIGKYGISTLTPLVHLMGAFYLACILFIGIGLAITARLFGFSLWRLLKYLREELVIILGTSSSETVLPRLIEKLTRAGCSRSVVGMVVPTGYSFNLDGTCIYLTMAAIFLAQAMNIPLSIGDQLTLLAVLLLTSKGAAGVTGSGFVVLAATLASVGTIPMEGLALILGIDRFMSEGRALTNFIGNAVATIVVAKWERAVDEKTMDKVLNA